MIWRSCVKWSSRTKRFATEAGIGFVATSQLALRWMCNSPRTGCARRTTPIYMWREQAIIEWSRWVISIVAATVRSLRTCFRFFRSQQLDWELAVGGDQWGEQANVRTKTFKNIWGIYDGIPKLPFGSGLCWVD